jgi:peroxiredoxin
MSQNTSNWIRITLILAAVYNLAWGTWVILRPGDLFHWLQIESPNYPLIWQGLGMVVGVYGIGYAFASFDPVRYWPIVLVGLIGKILGPIGFIISYWNGNVAWPFFWQILFNDMIWWVPFAAILYFVLRETSAPRSSGKTSSSNPDKDPADSIESQLGQTINQISERSPLMLVFLRHGGCTFCRQTLADLQDARDEILEMGVEVALVHMGSPMEGTMMLSKYELDFFHRFSDPECRLYRRFGFERGRFGQLFSPKIIWRGIWAGIFGGHGIGKPQGDSFQLPGVVVFYHRKSILALPAEDASERYNYLEIAKRAQAIVDSLATEGSGVRVKVLN